MLGGESAKPRDAVRRIEVPGVFRQADEIANGGFGGPGTPQRRARHLRRDARRQESLDVGACCDRLDWRQARGIKRRFRTLCRRTGGPRFSRARRCAVVWLRSFVRLLRRRVFAPGPPREKFLVIAHGRFPSECRGAPTPPDRSGRAYAFRMPALQDIRLRTLQRSPAASQASVPLQ